MKNDVILDGMIKGIEIMGGEFVRIDKTHVYFDIKTGSDIDNEVKLQRAKEAFFKTFNLGLKIRRK